MAYLNMYMNYFLVILYFFLKTFFQHPGGEEVLLEQAGRLSFLLFRVLPTFLVDVMLVHGH